MQCDVLKTETMTSTQKFSIVKIHANKEDFIMKTCSLPSRPKVIWKRKPYCWACCGRMTSIPLTMIKIQFKHQEVSSRIVPVFFIEIRAKDEARLMLLRHHYTNPTVIWNLLVVVVVFFISFCHFVGALFSNCRKYQSVSFFSLGANVKNASI